MLFLHTDETMVLKI